jgi:hypothetical protein
MSWMRYLRRGWWNAERARELQAHLDGEIDEHIARGMTLDEARNAAPAAPWTVRAGSACRVRQFGEPAVGEGGRVSSPRTS